MVGDAYYHRLSGAPGPLMFLGVTEVLRVLDHAVSAPAPEGRLHHLGLDRAATNFHFHAGSLPGLGAGKVANANGLLHAGPHGAGSHHPGPGTVQKKRIAVPRNPRLAHLESHQLPTDAGLLLALERGAADE